MGVITFQDLTFGIPEAEYDIETLKNSFFETENWKRVHSDQLLPLIIGRKGSGKSAIAQRLEIENQDKGNFISLTPSAIRHVELRELLSLLISKNVSWQYIYSKVWEGVLLGQIIKHCEDTSNKNHYYNFSSELTKEIEIFKKKCGFYVNVFEDALGEVLEKFIINKTKEILDGLSLRKLRNKWNHIAGIH